MRVLSVRPPWAYLIANGIKPVELRSWQTAYRGPLAIHVGKTIDRDAIKNLVEVFPQHRAIVEDMSVRGAIIAVCDLFQIFDYQKNSLFYFMHADRHYAPSMGFEDYGWFLPPQFTRKLKTPVFVRGQQGLFNISDDLLPVECLD